MVNIATAESESERKRRDALEEAFLMERIAAGDRGSFRELHRRYAGVIFSTIYKVLNDHQDAEDVSQEVFAQIWKKAHLYEPAKGKPLTWAATMARNRAIDRLRAKQRRSKLSTQLGEEADGIEHGVESPDSSNEADARERSVIVRSAVMRLSAEQREAIELAYFSGLTQAEIAERVGAPLGTVKARIRRGVLRLHGMVSRKM